MTPKIKFLIKRKAVTMNLVGGTVNGGWNSVTIQMKSVCTIHFLGFYKNEKQTFLDHY